MYLIGPSIYIIILLQLFNWFDKHMIAITFGLLQISKSCGYITWVFTMNAESENIRLIICSSCLLIFAVVDYFTFLFYPLMADIFIDVEGRSRKDAEHFTECWNYVNLHQDPSAENKLTVFQLFYNNR